jgi:hypothetical protein
MSETLHCCSPLIGGFPSGQEGATIDCDEGIPITPFNLDEEMQEGHFDAEGNYYVKKDEEIRDNWLDNIDWVRTTSSFRDNNNNKWDLYSTLIELKVALHLGLMVVKKTYRGGGLRERSQ